MKRVTFVVADPSYIVRRGLVNTIEEIGNTSVVREVDEVERIIKACLLYTSPSPRDGLLSRMPSSA